jgi:two-component system, chemotaxis family, chemotaxis protein CheY
VNGRETRTVLVVDDDIDGLEAMIDVLRAAGYEAVGAVGGRQAIDYLRGAPRLPDVILLDLMMPYMDGHGFRAEQRSDARLAAIPVVVVTADGDARGKAAALEAAGGLTKPLEMRPLLEMVDRVCSPERL